ncbi:MAG TPA: hypothetical protein VEO95_04160 [Chthoniobacteraceae bacterium]|nr:hypothetical protein [Chthoniobacteraceae bacterium]
MLVRNYAKPFCIAGFILAEIYMLLVVLAPPGHDHARELPVPPMIETALPPGSPVPVGYLISRIVALSIFFGPFGALVGLGVGLIFSALVQWLRGRRGNSDGDRN